MPIKNQRTFKPHGDCGLLIDSDGRLWRPSTELDYLLKKESAVVYMPKTFDFRRYTPA